MAFFKKSASSNFDLYTTHAYYTPGVGGLFTILVLLLAGSLLGSLIVGVLSLAVSISRDWVMLLSYPIMFIPPMMYASSKGRGNLLFETGYALDSNNFAPVGGAVLALCSMLGVLGCSVVMDEVNSWLPDMPKWLEDTLTGLTSGNFVLNFICVSIFAPIFEEWLCRGMVLRGLLNSRKKDGSALMSPVWAIIISALFFGIIHFNPWQALPAFAIGMLMGYVYYKTGSLKLTMLMHFTNNTFALILGQSDALSEAESLKELLPLWAYILVLCAGILVIAGSILVFRKVATPRPEGACDPIAPEV